MQSDSIKKLIEIFSKFPTVGPRTASRFVYYLLNSPKSEAAELTKAIKKLKESVKQCGFCFNSYETEDKLCPICGNKNRDRNLLCVVEKESDLSSIEKTKKYRGLYFILGGNISGFKKDNREKIRIAELIERVKKLKKFGIEEIIIATNYTAEGNSTALYLERILKPLNIKTSRLGLGLPIGGELEYADEETLMSALESRH